MAQGNKIRSYLLHLAWFGLSLVAISVSFNVLSEMRSARKSSEESREAMYLPSGAGLEFMTFGYRNALSDALWLNTVSYFGKHFTGDKDYRWLGHMCDLVVRLNPKVFEPYYFCSTMLAWEVRVPDASIQAIRFLTRGIEAHPEDWFFYYLRGFYYIYFMHDRVHSRDDFLAASQKPGAHPIAGRLAAKSLSELEDPETAIGFLKGLLARTTDKTQREAFEHKIRELKDGRAPKSH